MYEFTIFMCQMNEHGIVVECTACERRNRIPFARLHRRGNCAACKTPLPYVHHTVSVKYETVFDNLISKVSVPVLVEFHGGAGADPDAMPASDLEVVASCAQGDYIVARVDVGVHIYLTERYAIRSTPTLILFVQGIDMGRLQHRLTAAGLEKYVRSVLR